MTVLGLRPRITAHPAVALGSIVIDAFSGGTPSTRQPEYWNGSIPWTTSAQLNTDLRLTSSARSISEAGLRNSSAKMAPAGSVLVGTRVGVGKTAVLELAMAISQDLTALILRSEIADAEFVAYALRSASVQQRFESNKRGATIKGVPREDLLRLSIPLPPLDEQKRVARILSTIQLAKDACIKSLGHAEALRDAMTSRLFNSSWPMRPIGSIAKVGNGSTPKRDDQRYWRGGVIPWLTSAKIHEGRIEFADEFVTDIAIRECHLPLVPAGNVLIAITGQGKTLGNSALLAIDSCVSQHLAYIKLTSSDILPEFLHYYLSTRYENLRSVALGGGSTKGALTCGFLSGYPVPVPPIEDQQAVVDALDRVDLKISAERSTERALEGVFTAALHSLMGSGS